jgi:hypothetical protein
VATKYSKYWPTFSAARELWISVMASVLEVVSVKTDIGQLFCTYSVNIFINYRPACSDTEKGGKGESDTGMITRNGVTRRIARGYMRSSSLRRL